MRHMSYSFLSQIEVYLLYSKIYIMCFSPIIIFRKHILLFFTFSTLTFLFATSNSLAQSNNGGIIFQALARDAFHNPANSRKIYIQSSIIQHSNSGLVVLSEEHITNTDYTGVFTISIGLGSKIGGAKASLVDIDWVNGPYFLNIKIAITPVSPTDDWFFHKEWVDLGTAAFGVVPYALNVLGAKTVNTSSTDSIIYMSKLSIADTSVMLSGYSKKSYVDSLLNNKVSLNELPLLVRAFDSASLSNRINMRLSPSDTISLSNRIEDKLYIKDSMLKYVTPSQLAAKTVDLLPINSILNTKLNINDTASMLTARFARDTMWLSSRINLKVDLLNRSINMNSPMDYSNDKYPSVKAIKDYVDTQISSIASSVITVSPLSFTSPLVNTSSIVSIPSASSTTNGYLTSTNWNIFNNKINTTEKAANNGVATLGADGKIPSTQIPATSFSRVDVVTSEAAMLLLPVTLTGSFAIRTDVNKSFVLSQLPASSILNWVEIVAPGTVTSVNGQTGPAISLTTADIGTSINKNYVTDVMLSGVLSNTSGTNTGDQDLSSFATTINLNLKANTTDVNTSLALKANILDVTSSLSLKANASDVATSLTSKASTTDLTSGLATKVDKVTGKELSTNDYSTLEKDKLAAISGTNTGDQDLSSYATTASVALKVDKVTGKELSTNDYSTLEKDKLAAISGTNTGDQDLSSYATTASVALKVDKVTGKELSTNDYTTTEKSKLAAITGINTGDQDVSSFATLAGTETLNNKTLVIPILGDATATSLITSGEIKAKRYVQFSNTAVSPPSSGAMTLDLSRGNVIQVDLAYSITGITFTNEAVGTYIIKFKQTVGSKTINFPDAWVWSGGIEPSVTSTVGRTDIVTLINDGTFYYAAIVQNFF